MLPEFDLSRPQALSEALALMAERAPNVLPLAGGTNVIVELQDRRTAPAHVVDLTGLSELRGIRQVNNHVEIGAGVKIAQLLTDPLIAEHARPLRQAAAVLGNPLVRNRATVAGNLVNASPAADTAPPLLALGAEVELASVRGRRCIRLEDFITGVNRTLREPDELMTAIRFPIPPDHSAAAFDKLGLRKAAACSVVSAAVLVEWEESGACRQARIALGAVAPRPLRALAAEDALQGQWLTPEIIASAAQLAAEAASPIDDIRATAAYRRRATQVMVRRLLASLTPAAIQESAR